MSHPLHIAVADGEPAVGPLEEVLARLGHQVVCVARTGRQLVEQCRLLHPDLVIAGVKLADLDGIAAAEEVCRERPTPIILVSEEEEAEVSQRALDNPFILACLPLPIQEANLRRAVALAVRRFEQFESLRKEAADLRQTLEDRKLIERAKGVVMRHVGLDESEAFRRLRKMASHQNRKLVEVAQTILTAGDVFHQMEQLHDERTRNGRTGNGDGRKRPTTTRHGTQS